MEPETETETETETGVPIELGLVGTNEMTAGSDREAVALIAMQISMHEARNRRVFSRPPEGRSMALYNMYDIAPTITELPRWYPRLVCIMSDENAPPLYLKVYTCIIEPAIDDDVEVAEELKKLPSEELSALLAYIPTGVLYPPMSFVELVVRKQWYESVLALVDLRAEFFIPGNYNGSMGIKLFSNGGMCDPRALLCLRSIFLHHRHDEDWLKWVREFLDGYAAEHSPTSCGYTYLHHLCERRPTRTNAVRFLIELGWDVNCGDPTPLMIAAKMGSYAACVALLRAGADPGIRGWYYGRNALHMNLMQILYPESKHNDPDRSTFDRTGFTVGHDSVVMLLLSSCPSLLNESDDLGWTPLMLAVDSDREDAMEMLLDAGADINATLPVSKKGALHIAAAKSLWHLWTRLIQRNANVDATDAREAVSQDVLFDCAFKEMGQRVHRSFLW